MYTLGQNIANQTNSFNTLSNRRLISDDVVAHYADLAERQTLANSESIWLGEITSNDADDYYSSIYNAIIDYNNLSLTPNSDILFTLLVAGIISNEEYTKLMSLVYIGCYEE